jgi:hypothetical protein
MLLLKNTSGVKDVFSFIVDEILTTYNTCISYLKQNINMLEVSQIGYINECLRFLFFIYLFYNDEEPVKSFFNRIRVLT